MSGSIFTSAVRRLQPRSQPPVTSKQFRHETHSERRERTARLHVTSSSGTVTQPGKSHPLAAVCLLERHNLARRSAAKWVRDEATWAPCEAPKLEWQGTLRQYCQRSQRQHRGLLLLFCSGCRSCVTCLSTRRLMSLWHEQPEGGEKRVSSELKLN